MNARRMRALPRWTAGHWRNRLYVLAIIFVGIALLRIIATYSVFSQTWDEPAHIASGMEWLERGTYTYERQHPPLARLAVALGPYLAGLRAPSPYRFDSQGRLVSSAVGKTDRMWREGLSILHSRDQYVLNLALARLGIIPFFLLGAVVLWLWMWKLFDRETALDRLEGVV